MKLFIKTCLLVFFICLGSLTAKESKQSYDAPREFNQLYTYPNNFEAPTNTTAMKILNYTSPYLSHVLFEADSKRSLSNVEFLRLSRFQTYRLTKGETEAIFEFVDTNKDDLISSVEWDEFNGLYVFPFEACDKNHDYLLDANEFADCFDADPRSRFIIFRRKNNDNKYQQMLWAITTRAKDLINFYDYLFIRRSMFAWVNCLSNSKFMCKQAFKCAIKSGILPKFRVTADIDHIYNAAIHNANDLHIIELDFINYIRVLFALNEFSFFGTPTTVPYIEKFNMIKAIREDRVPTNFEESEVDFLFALIETNPLKPNVKMNFNTFYFFWNLHRLFNKHSVSRPLLLGLDEFRKLWEDEYIHPQIKKSVENSRTDFTQKEYQEASLMLQRKRPNEAHYFFNFKEQENKAAEEFKFKQDASENTAAVWNASTVNDTYFMHHENPKNIETLFYVFVEINKQVWTKNQYYKAFTLLNLFMEMITDWRQIVQTSDLVDHLQDRYETVNPPINYMQRENYPMYKYLPRDFSIDALLFVSIENYRHKFRSYLKSSSQIVYESYVKTLLQDFGMAEMPDTVIDLGKKGFDQLRRRTFDPYEVAKNVFIVQATAAENKRGNEFVKKFELKQNYDPSRRFMRLPRRAQASPFV